MKPVLLFIACMLTASLSFAQDNEQDAPAPPPPARYSYTGSEVILGHGFLPVNQGSSSGYGNGRLNYNNDTYTGAIFGTYRYHISKLISLGVTAAYGYEEGDWSDYNIYYNSYNNNYGGITPFAPNYSYTGRFKRSSFTIAPEITFNYCDLGHGLARLYSVVGIGYTYRNETLQYAGMSEEYMSPASRVAFNMYVSPFGVRFGRRLGGFFELGIGYKGILNYGVTYRL